MIDFFMSLMVAVVFGAILTVVSGRFPVEMRRWVWLAYAEYLLACGAELLFTRVISSGDTVSYGETGKFLARLMGEHFEWAFPEVIRLLIREPSAFDMAVPAGGGSNTASMHAISGLIVMVCGGSDIAAHVFVSMSAFCATLSLYTAFQDAYPEAVPRRLFIATVMVPSVSFWTSALHKESMAMIGFGFLFAAWKSVRRGHMIRAPFYVAAGGFLVFLFRAPAFAPIALGIATHFVLERAKRIKDGRVRTLLGPIYAAIAFLLLLIGVTVLGRYVPELAADKLSETIRLKQVAWSTVADSNSSDIGVDDLAPTTGVGQLMRLPASLGNSLFRPQLWDVRNASMLISAVEMTVLTIILLRAILLHGITGTAKHLRSSPFLAMCMVTAIAGFALVGLITRNLGSLARYRTPFLPFYCAAMMSVAYMPKRKKRTLAELARPLAEPEPEPEPKAEAAE